MNCWYCGKSHGEMLFSTEFDTAVHEECLRKRSWGDPDKEDVECRIMCEELGVK